VPFWPRAGEAGTAVLFGAALGAAPAVLALLAEARSVRGWPDTAGTAMDTLLPWAEAAAGALVAPFWVAIAAIPFAALAVAVRDRGRRLAVVAVVVLCLTAIGAGEIGLARSAGAALGGTLLVGATVWAFGRAAALSWVVSALVAAALGGLRAARVAAHPLDVADGLVGATVALALIGARLSAPRAAPARPAAPASRSRGRAGAARSPSGCRRPSSPSPARRGCAR
jgi:hypothetical protein